MGEGVAVAEGVGVIFTAVGEAVDRLVGVCVMGSVRGVSGGSWWETGSATGETNAESAKLLNIIIRPKAMKTLIVMISPALAGPSTLGE